MMASNHGRKAGGGGCMMMMMMMMMMYLHDVYGFEETATLVDSSDSRVIQMTYQHYSKLTISFDAQITGSQSLICYPSKWLTSENGEELQIPDEDDDAKATKKKMLKEGTRLEKGETGWLKLDVVFKQEQMKRAVEKVKAWFHVKNVGEGRAVIRVEAAEGVLKRMIESCLRERLMRSERFSLLRASMKTSAKRVLPGRHEEEVRYELVDAQLEREQKPLGGSSLTLSLSSSRIDLEGMKKLTADIEQTYEKIDLGTVKCNWRVEIVSEKKAKKVIDDDPLLRLDGLADSRSFRLTACIVEGEAQKKVLLAAAYGLLRLKASVASKPLRVQEWYDMLKNSYFKATIIDGDESHTFTFEITYLMLDE